MCGIAGIAGGIFLVSDAARTLERMGAAIAHRGPDDHGIWIDQRARVGLVHRRLSILDLSPAGHQPMISVSGRYVLAFNGEIYNHTDMRERLVEEGLGVHWRGHSDTETLLAGIDAWGVDRTLRFLVGMFAFAVFDRKANKIILARDRFGEKPLYYGWVNGTLAFASELSAIRELPNCDLQIDREALALFTRFKYVPAPHSIYKGIFKLPPASFVEIPIDSIDGGIAKPPVAYWSALDVSSAARGSRPEFKNEEDAADALELILGRAVAQQMIADVPLGAFLSGGIDSSTIVALMQKHSSRPIKTFTIGYSEDEFNEAVHAKCVAQHLKTDHTELYLSSADALNVVPSLPSIFSEPFSDASQIPTYLVSKMARQHVTVSLSGDGGDEMFGGYTRYFFASSLWEKITRIPRPLRKVAGQAIGAMSPKHLDLIYRNVEPILPQKWRMRLPSAKLKKGAALLRVDEPSELYNDLVSDWDGAGLVLGADGSIKQNRPWPVSYSFAEQMMLQDSISYLPDDILVKVDRASMAVGLESRAPFLDHRVFEFAWGLPMEFRIRGTQGKWLLRKVLHRYVPPSLVDRPKMGFGVPIGLWLRGPLRDWAEDLLSEKRLREDGFFDVASVRTKWTEHLSGRSDWQYHLWDILMFQAWYNASRITV